VLGSIWQDGLMGSNFLPRSIGLKRGIGHFSSPHIDEGILHDANDKSKIAAWVYYALRC
jgi:hypothetical protein